MRSRDGNWSSQGAQPFLQKIDTKSNFLSPSLSRRGSETVLNPAVNPIPIPTFQKQATFNEAIVY